MWKTRALPGCRPSPSIPHSMATVLVTDGDQRAALAVVRSLGRAGHRVLVAAEGPRSLAGASRWAAGRLVVPDPLRQADAFVASLGRAVTAEGVDVLLPVTEPSLIAVLAHAQALAPARIPFPPLQTFLKASDKAWVAQAAAEAGLAAPGQRVLASPAEAVELPERAREPLVLKPGRSVQGGRKLGVSYVAEGGPLRSSVQALPEEAFPLLLQDRVVGPGTGVFLLRWGGRTRAAFAHRRLREKPPSGGVSVLRESVPLDPGLQRACDALLERLDWQGVAMVELKEDMSTGRSHVMEINGRFWGSLQLAIDAGVDFPRLLVALALGEDAEGPADYRVGVRSRWLMGDLDHLLIRLRRSPAALHLPPDAPGRLRVVRDFLLGFLPPNREEILRLGDPGPFLAEVRGWLGALRGR